MTSSNFNLRNVTPDVMLLLKKKAIEKKTSVNALILQFIEQSLGVTHPIKKNIFHDLDHLAGTWNKEDKEVFDNNIKSFEMIDKELWK